MKPTALSLPPSLLIYSKHYVKIFPIPQSNKPRINNQSNLRRFASKSNMFHDEERRSANYHPTIWDPNYIIESLNSPYTYEYHGTRLEELKHQIRNILQSTNEDGALLKLIDSMQRMGIAYHFQQDIIKALNLVAVDGTQDLYTTSLHFRLLRQNLLPVSSDAFDKFKDENGKYIDSLRMDWSGLLSLYEASHLGNEEEHDLEEANRFSTRHLISQLGRQQPSNLAEQVKLALDVPLHWRMPRLEALNFINFYQNHDTKNLILLELAKLDYNLVQSVHQRELKELARWWKALGFKEKLQFSRDRLVENYMWAMGMIFEPNFSKCRMGLTKFICILTAIDDMYDIYGSLQELELFTSAVSRWDVGAIEELPEYMKICYFAMFNFANEVAYDVMKDEGFNVLPYLKTEWINLCESYLKEARWFYRGYTPNLDEYLENGWISIGGHAAIVHSFVLLGEANSMDCLKNASSALIRFSSLITRLANDLGTSKAESTRGDVTKSVKCHMIEEGTSEEEAKEHVHCLIRNFWKKLNEENKRSSLPKSHFNIILNMARSAQCIFQHGDGVGTSIGITRHRLISLISNPIH